MLKSYKYSTHNIKIGAMTTQVKKSHPNVGEIYKWELTILYVAYSKPKASVTLPDYFKV